MTGVAPDPGEFRGGKVDARGPSLESWGLRLQDIEIETASSGPADYGADRGFARWRRPLGGAAG